MPKKPQEMSLSLANYIHKQSFTSLKKTAFWYQISTNKVTEQRDVESIEHLK